MTAFSKNLRKLREAQKISQKSAAASLGVSQALLSHYEKGIRECGLAFLCRAAKFYCVSTDYMLGLCEAQPEISGEIKKDGCTYSISMLYKNLITHALAYLFNNMRDAKYREISVLSGKYLTHAVYRLCSILYGGVDKPANLPVISELKYIGKIESMNAPLGEYNFDSPYLNNIIKTAEAE